VKRVVLLLCALLAVTVQNVAAQCLPPLLPPEEAPPCRESYPSWTGELAALGANALLGGLSAGVMQKAKKGSFSAGFLRGLAGGAVIYGGKRIAVERFGGAGLVGREVAALGSSMVRNSGEGRGMLEEVALPVGPVWLFLQSGAPRVRARIDVYSTAWMLWAIQSSELDLDYGRSLSAGAPVFVTNNRVIISDSDSTHALGVTEGAVMMISDIPAYGRESSRRVFEHERVHVLQMDQVFRTITDPFEDMLIDRVPYVRRLNGYIELNLAAPLFSLINDRIPAHLDRPWETEAIFFSR
jgi:hypothetical protein